MPHASARRILMLAAEHGGLPGGKVGGIGDVLQELPPALAAHGVAVDVVLPSYGVYHQQQGAILLAELSLEFAGSLQSLEVYRLASIDGAGCLVLHHPAFGVPPGQIYHHDPAEQPFATDANIYALFSAGAIAMLEQSVVPMPDVVHLHDWHAATFAPLARASRALRSLRLVYTIHNLALQGIRPLANHPSSLAEWFPDTEFPLDELQDPRYKDCYNPVRSAVLMADKVHVVSPTYATEVLRANDESTGRHGGEGLEHDLQARADDGDLVGILNGCHYENGYAPTVSDVEAFARERINLLDVLQSTLDDWMAQNEYLRTSDYLARQTLSALRPTFAGRMLLTSVGRVTDQKVGLLLCSHESRKGTLLDRLLLALGDRGALVLLGSGDEALESKLVEHAARHDNFLFARGYSDVLANALYSAGDLFLMPSLFEPCGISQLLAMRAGQPCLVHATGGLRDTINDAEDGFQFEGDDLLAMADACEHALQRAIETRANSKAWREMRSSAAAKRVTWNTAALSYLRHLYDL